MVCVYRVGRISLGVWEVEMFGGSYLGLRFYLVVSLRVYRKIGEGWSKGLRKLVLEWIKLKD